MQVGITVVGGASLLDDSSSSSSTSLALGGGGATVVIAPPASAALLGMLLVVAAEAVQSAQVRQEGRVASSLLAAKHCVASVRCHLALLQVVVEDFYMSDLKLGPLTVVG